MDLLTNEMGGLGAVLLPVAAGLLLEELTLGGLVRLIFAPWPRTGNRRSCSDKASTLRPSRKEHNNRKGGRK